MHWAFLQAGMSPWPPTCSQHHIKASAIRLPLKLLRSTATLHAEEVWLAQCLIIQERPPKRFHNLPSLLMDSIKFENYGAEV